MTKPLTEERFSTVIEGLRETMAENTRTIIGHFNKGQVLQNERMNHMDERFDQVDVKLDAIIEMLTMKREMRNLVRELGKKGIALDESQIFVS